MIALIYIDGTLIGESFLKVVDESMGGVTGNLIPSDNYQNYKKEIQSISEKRGITNIGDFDIKIRIDGNVIIPEGGIGIIDLKEFEEIIIESAGINQKMIEKLKNEIE